MSFGLDEVRLDEVSFDAAPLMWLTRFSEFDAIHARTSAGSLGKLGADNDLKGIDYC